MHKGAVCKSRWCTHIVELQNSISVTNDFMYVCMYVCTLCSGIGGRLGVGSSLGAYVRKITAMEKPENLDDPREAVLKYAKVHAPLSFTVYVCIHYVLCSVCMYVRDGEGWFCSYNTHMYIYSACNTVHTCMDACISDVLLSQQIAEEDPYFIAPAYKK